MSDYRSEREDEPDVFVRDRMSQARDLMIEAIDHHEEVQHDGGPCVSERIGIAAFMAHSAGITLDAVPMLVVALAEYQAAHEAHHGRNGNGHAG